MFSELKKLEEKIGVDFKNKALLLEALTHRSYLNENPGVKTGNNERLEYLGDAVLELVVTEELFHKFPERQEGELTLLRAALVNYVMLGRIAREIGLEKYVLLSRGEAKDFGKAREVILANAIEALIGALYLDKGYDIAGKFIKDNVLNHLEEVIANGSYRDSKSSLQEIIQEKTKVTPTYKVLEERGPDHAREFVVGVFFGGELQATGTGSSKQEAENDAAGEALRDLRHKK
ncbi:MAG: Ribonuclease 3 [Candidatus Jorgensenbacteria bacterium GW2011_GWA1_48_13]|uniref:Ribonuclease 3 n=2 Tax=Candidatus Joergenseniibacteriota TaxID=1752739 RepID=A0A0G1YJ69_9BACT|nr:MAG: Ribonuclease 3 [Candidatus Jorgensenbacteria bacterium GW2011_GWA1_48_13]KKU97964.1 MAG: Ribonuclease 3 [Candidatus Jorgensenbacteria bacterium GW2011_GWC1_48_8]KKW15032.1 MAG: Ribonuclease 3 [Candidatus Jorgensenbacteria bacterium GW2011_GWB1_50_10]